MILNMKKILALIVILSFTSCQSILLKIITANKSIANNTKVLYNDKTDQKIVFFPMVHVGQKDYYESAKKIIDTLRQNDYSFYYENIAIHPDAKLDSNEIEIYHKKTRKILGYHPSLDSTNQSLPKILRKNNLMVQDYRFMGLKKGDHLLDLPKNQIIDSIEANYNEIKLTKCDLETPLNEDYNCESLRKYKWALTHEFRDQYIGERILEIKKNKIALIYGRMHWFFIYADLRDAGFEIIKGKI